MKVDGRKLEILSRVAGSDTLIETESGVWVATVTFNCSWDLVFTLMPRRDVSKHPDFNFLKCTGAKVTRGKGGIAIVEASYTGGMNVGGTNSGINSAIIEVSSTVTEEPIETHPRFEEMAGKPESELWPGVYDEDGKFNGFPKNDNSGGDCPFFGVTSYMAPRTVVTRTRQSRKEPTIKNVGKLEAPPTGGGGVKYLKTEHSYTKNGGSYTEVESWLGPAEGKTWDKTIYNS